MIELCIKCSVCVPVASVVLCKNGGLLQERSLGPKYQYFDFYGGSSFPRRRLFSTEEADFYGGGSFLRRKLLSMEEADFYGGG